MPSFRAKCYLDILAFEILGVGGLRREELTFWILLILYSGVVNYLKKLVYHVSFVLLKILLGDLRGNMRDNQTVRAC